MPGLYLHIPFCEKKCVYCDFYSIEKTGFMDDFLGALLSEITLLAESTQPKESFSTVFLGGGTPSLLTPAQLESIFARLHKHYNIEADAEITMECNPGTVDMNKLNGYRSLGVNRLSFGVQSFWEDELAFLGRIHNADQARRSVRLAQEAGFDNISLDLMFALPMHTPERWEHTLKEAAALDTQHISAYSLIYEEGTPLYTQLQNGNVTPLAEEPDAEMFLFTSEFLRSRGFLQYEVSNFAKPKEPQKDAEISENDLYISRHNLNYWRCGEYLSFGPSAHSYWNGERRWNYSNLTTYLDEIREGHLPVANRERITKEQALTEYISLGLRSDGIRLRRFEDLFKFDFLSRNSSAISGYVRDGLLTVTDEYVRCTPKGYLWCDSLTLEFLRNN